MSKIKFQKKTLAQNFILILLSGILTACGNDYSENSSQASKKPAYNSENSSNILIEPNYRMGEFSDTLVTSNSSTQRFINDIYISSDTAQYKNYTDNSIKQVANEPVSTFSLDMDTGSYANSRRFLSQGRMPHPDAVRVEEFINYFPSTPNEDLIPLVGSPFSVAYELTPSPWNADKVLLKVNIKANDVNFKKLPPSNLTFLVDTSGSMYGPDRLELLQKSLKLLVDKLRPEDKVAIVTYAGSEGVALPPTSGRDKAKILAAIDNFEAGGSTAGGAGLKLAYKMAAQNKVANGINRILLATDGDFNVGIRSTEELKAFVISEKEKGITLSTLGFGDDNFNEQLMVQIADAGNGNYSYIDSLKEAQKVLQEEMSATLVTVAKDVKAQIEFNPQYVLDYRQIGYEKRQLKQEDFNNDKVDAGDIGAGKKTTVLYELTLVGNTPSIDPLRYQAKKSEPNISINSNEIAFLKLRWKAPKDKKSNLVSLPLEKKALVSNFDKASSETRFIAAVAAFGQKLRNNPELSQTSYQQIASWANNAKGKDPHGYRSEFVQLVRKAAALDDKK